jgi:hypothetical protein
MAAQIAAHPAEQSPKGLPGRETTPGADQGSFAARYSLPEQSAQGATELSPHPFATHYWKRVQRKQAISAPIARRRTSVLALTVTFGLVLIVTGGTSGYRWPRRTRRLSPFIQGRKQPRPQPRQNFEIQSRAFGRPFPVQFRFADVRGIIHRGSASPRKCRMPGPWADLNCPESKVGGQPLMSPQCHDDLVSRP